MIARSGCRRLGVVMAALGLVWALSPTASGQEKSNTGGLRANVAFQNVTGKTVTVFWVNFQGQEEQVTTIAPGQAYQRPSTGGILWRFKVDGQEVGKYRVTNQPQQTYRIEGQVAGGGGNTGGGNGDIQRYQANKPNMGGGQQPPPPASGEKSVAGGLRTNVAFENTTGKTVTAFWVNFQGREEQVATIPPGQPYRRQSTGGILWTFKVEGREVGRYRMTNQPQQSYRIEDQMAGGGGNTGGGNGGNSGDIQRNQTNKPDIGGGQQQQPSRAGEKSTTGGLRANVSFENTTGKTVTAFWVNFQGREEQVATIPPGQPYRRQSTGGILWTFKVEGREVGRYRMTNQPQQAYRIADQVADNKGGNTGGGGGQADMPRPGGQKYKVVVRNNVALLPVVIYAQNLSANQPAPQQLFVLPPNMRSMPGQERNALPEAPVDLAQGVVLTAKVGDRTLGSYRIRAELEQVWDILDPSQPNASGLAVSRERVPEREQVLKKEPEKREGNYLVRTEEIDAARAMDTNFVLDDPSSRIVFPGALIYAEEFHTGNYKEIVTDRKPLTISTNLAITKGSVRGQVQDPKLSTVREAINGMIAQQTVGQLDAVASFEVTQVHSSQQMALAIGGNFSRSGFSVENTFNMSMENEKTMIVAKFLQEYYTVDVDPLRNPEAFFATPDKAAEVLQSGKTPLYVSNVKYGRAAYFFLKTNKDAMSVKNVLNLAYESKLGLKAGLDIGVEFKKMMQQSEMKVLLIGGTGETSVKAVDGYEGFLAAIKEGGSFGPGRLGRPISYQLSFLDGSPAFMNVTTRYTKRTVIRDTNRYRVTLLRLSSIYVSNDEEADDWGNGCHEVYGDISVCAGHRDGVAAYSQFDADIRPHGVAASNATLQQKLSRTPAARFGQPIGSANNLIYTGYNPNDEEGKSYRIDKSFDFSRNDSQTKEDEFVFRIQVYLVEVDSWSSNDIFAKTADIPLKGGVPTLGTTFVELQNGTDKIRVHYKIEVVND